MESELMQTQLTYWKNQLAAPLPRLAFPKVHRRNKRRSFRTGRKEVSLEKDFVCRDQNPGFQGKLYSLHGYASCFECCHPHLHR